MRTINQLSLGTEQQWTLFGETVRTREIFHEHSELLPLQLLCYWTVRGALGDGDSHYEKILLQRKAPCCGQWGGITVDSSWHLARATCAGCGSPPARLEDALGYSARASRVAEFPERFQAAVQQWLVDAAVEPLKVALIANSFAADLLILCHEFWSQERVRLQKELKSKAVYRRTDGPRLTI